MQFRLNTVIEWPTPPQSNTKARRERILNLEYSGDRVILFDIDDHKAYPTVASRRELEQALKLQTAKILLEDPFAHLCRPEEDIDAHPRPKRIRLKSFRDHRDRVFEKLKLGLDGTFGDLLDPRERPAIITQLVKRTGWSRQTVTKYLRRWWRCGQIPNAFLPHYDRSGGPGKNRIAQPGGPKRGRPSNATKQGRGTTGRNATPEDIQWIQTAVVPLFQHHTGRNFPAAYDKAVKQHYAAEAFAYQPESGLYAPQSAVQRLPPTLDQAIYYCEKALDRERCAKKRYGELTWPLEYRAILGDSSGMMVGPGAVYQIDATLGDIYLVSSIDRKRVIGRPVIYVVIDVFSRLVVGFAVLLAGPSWAGAKQALLSAYSDKTALAEEYDMPLSSAAWPSRYLPTVLLADNGELAGLRSDELQGALGITVQNAPPYRADWKGIVERHFRTVHERIDWMPGYVYGDSRRGGPDYRLDAKLTLAALRRLLILCFVTYNTTHRLLTYALTPPMIEDGVQPYAAAIWRWGLQNSNASPRQIPEERVLATLLPSGEASLTSRGISFQGMHYTCPRAEQDQWFTRYRPLSGRVPVAWNPSNPKRIYLRLNGGRDIVPCDLVDRAVEKNFCNADWHEIMDYAAVKGTQDRAAVLPDLQAQVPYDHLADELVAQETALSQAAQEGHSHRSRLTGMKAARLVEATMDTYRLVDQTSGPSQPIQPNDDADEYIAPPIHSQLLHPNTQEESDATR